jgi:hypothetical protein
VAPFSTTLRASRRRYRYKVQLLARHSYKWVLRVHQQAAGLNLHGSLNDKPMPICVQPRFLPYRG